VPFFFPLVSTSRKAPRPEPQAQVGERDSLHARTGAPLHPGKAAAFVTGRTGRLGDRRIESFDGTVCVTLPRKGKPQGLDVFAVDADRVARYHDADTDTAVYVIGRATHPSLSGDAMLKWCVQSAGKDPGAFRKLLGAFVIALDDRRNGRVSFVSDALGLMPWFVGEHGGRLVAGTDVLNLCDAGLSSGEVDYDSVAAWLCYSLVSTGGSIVRDYRRIPHGTVSSFHPDGGRAGQTPYAKLTYTQKILPPELLVEELFDRTRAAVDALTRGVGEVNLPLSGGYDSRLLCAMACARKDRLQFRATVVESTPDESVNARRVAKALGVPLEVMPCERSKIDLFDDPLYYIAEGFPVPRNLANAVARRHPGMPVLSGYLGDGIMRGPMTPGGMAFMGLDDREHNDEILAREAHTRCMQLSNRMHLLRDHIAPRAEARAAASLLAAVREGRASGRPIAWTNLYVRQRLYFAHIFLSHLDVADALIPYPSWDIVEFNATHTGSFGGDTYDHLFRRFFPELAGIPHNTKLPESPHTASGRELMHRHQHEQRPTRHLRHWASDLARFVPTKFNSTAITPRKLLKRLPSGLVLDGRYADDLGYLHRIHSFEERLRQARIRIDWSKI
jgi:hypothetical protein